jgi:hypothetical protein
MMNSWKNNKAVALFVLRHLKLKDKPSPLTMTTRPWKYGGCYAVTVITASSDGTETENYFVTWPNM